MYPYPWIRDLRLPRFMYPLEPRNPSEKGAIHRKRASSLGKGHNPFGKGVVHRKRAYSIASAPALRSIRAMLSDLKRCGRVLARVATDCDCRYTRNQFCSLAAPYRRQFPNHCLIFGDSPSDLRAVTLCVASWIFVLAVDLSPCTYCGLIFGSLCSHVSHCRRYGSRGEQGTFARSYRHSIATGGRRVEFHDSSVHHRPRAGVWTSSD